MTLGNIRSLGVHSLAVTCELCHQETILGADVWPDACSCKPSPRAWSAACGIIGADARPNWREMQAQGK
jgi:hypothetical protein